MNTHKQAPKPISRRKALITLGALSALGALSTMLHGCGGSGGSDDITATSTVNTTDSTNTTGSTDTIDSCTLIPEETEGPYPLSSVLSNSAIVRSDITEGKTGVPLTLTLKLVDVNNSCAAIANASVYIWHCDKDGVYSGYNQPGGNTLGETFLRGIQDVNGNGEVSFTTIYPGWYNGRITHIHFQVYLYSSSVATATSQIAFPQDVTIDVYNSSLYAARGQNTSVTSFSQDNVFSDGAAYQMATVDGDVNNGFVATLTVGIAA